ncbi:MAG: putative GNAT family N-acyltransferase [Alphaproteobacteria bacterium]|jgi:predicted GNAT family N-acyltransferase
MAIRVSEINSSGDMARAFEIRRVVFCDEQGVSRMEEFDGLDETCRHYLAGVEQLSVATARTRRLETGETKIERVAVLKGYRGLGVGRVLMRQIMEEIGGAPMVLNAQFHTKAFYKGLGFSTVGEIFDEAGIDHVKMIRNQPT